MQWFFSIRFERQASLDQAMLKQAGIDFQSADDLLTSQARSYVQYGEKKYYDKYMNEVEVDKNEEKNMAIIEKFNSEHSDIDLNRVLELINNALTLSTALADLETEAFDAVSAGELEKAREIMFGADYENQKAKIIAVMAEFQTELNTVISDYQIFYRNLSAITTWTSVGVLVVLLTFTTASLLSINKKIKLIGVLAGKATEIAKGNVDVDVDSNSNDEVGVLAKAFREMIDGIKLQASLLQRLAHGDFSENIMLRAENDSMNIAINTLIDSYNDTMQKIREATGHVSSGSREIADSSQNLSEGSTEQAAAIEQLSSSIGEIAMQTERNTEKAKKTAELSSTIRNNAQTGASQMDQMMNAVREISEASQNIGKVIKVIDDIAFQTNILALNAAVEAARAGEAGKGFAVVADEVRNLASKSAEAAKNTSGLIANSIEKAELGAKIATDTSNSLSHIVSGINESTKLVEEIAEASNEQAQGISQINTGIEQVAKVVQQNSATAEESAAASEEMRGQSVILNDLIMQFKLK